MYWDSFYVLPYGPNVWPVCSMYTWEGSVFILLLKWNVLWVSCQVWWFTVLFSSSISLSSSASLFIRKLKWGIKVNNYYCCIFYFSLQLFVFALCNMIVCLPDVIFLFNRTLNSPSFVSPVFTLCLQRKLVPKSIEPFQATWYMFTDFFHFPLPA